MTEVLFKMWDLNQHEHFKLFRVLTTAIQDNGINLSMFVVKNHTLNT